MKSFYIIDIGGTSIKFGISSLSMNEPLLTIPTPKTKEDIITAISKVICEFDLTYQNSNQIVESVMVSCPGLINEKGYIEKALYIDLSEVDLEGILKKVLCRNVRIYNDAKVQTIGRFVRNKALLYMCIGTAVGGGFCSDKGLFLGGHGKACEFGHILLKNNNNPCFCGREGCLDTVVSGKVMIERLGEEWWKYTHTHPVKEYLKQASYATYESLETLALLFDPDEICVCGNICKADMFRQELIELWKKNKWSTAQLDLTVDTWQYVYKGTSRLFHSENSYIIY